MYLSRSTISLTDLSAVVNVQFVCLHTTTFTIFLPPWVCTLWGPVLSQHRCDPNPVGFLFPCLLCGALLGFPNPHDSHFWRSFTSRGCKPMSGIVDIICRILFTDTCPRHLWSRWIFLFSADWWWWVWGYWHLLWVLSVVCLNDTIRFCLLVLVQFVFSLWIYVLHFVN